MSMNHEKRSHGYTNDNTATREKKNNAHNSMQNNLNTYFARK